ncbi:MAG TPA: hypothetical protein EYQ83_12905, partial [Acidobacteria bacterium]|nr:hypothetical protein [Acidobacteriota bacterium]
MRLRGQRLQLAEYAGQSVVDVRAHGAQRLGVFVECGREVHRHAVTEHDRVGHLHHGGLEVQGEQHALPPGVLDLGLEKLYERALAHECRIDDLARNSTFEETCFLLFNDRLPSTAELDRRLHSRAQDSEAVITERMARAADEMTHWSEYDYVVVNID